jgi:hypothetical protein
MLIKVAFVQHSRRHSTTPRRCLLLLLTAGSAALDCEQGRDVAIWHAEKSKLLPLLACLGQCDRHVPVVVWL